MTDPSKPPSDTETTLDLSKPTARVGRVAAAAAAVAASSAPEPEEEPIGELVGGKLYDAIELAEGEQPVPVLDLAIMNSHSDGALAGTVLKAIAEHAGTSLDTLHDQDDDPVIALEQERLRLAVEEVTGAIVRLSRRFHNQRSDGEKPTTSRLQVFFLPSRGKLAAFLEHESGDVSSKLLLDVPSSEYQPPVPAEQPPQNKPGAQTLAKPAAPPPAPAAPPEPPPQAPPAFGLGRPGLSRRGAPAGPVRR